MKWAQFLTCPYCAGWWIWLGWVALWWLAPGAALPLAVAVGGRAMVVGAQKLLIKSEDQEPSKDAIEVADAISDLARRQPPTSGKSSVVRSRS